MTKLVVFDWNGTLIADTLACLSADNKILQVMGGREVDLKTYRDTIIIPAKHFYIEHGCSEKDLIDRAQEVSHIFHDTYESRVQNMRTRRGAKEILHWLDSHNIDVIILSNHTVEGIVYQLKKLGLESYIKTVLANEAKDASLKYRNKQEKLRHYIDVNDLNPSDVVIVGDSMEEVEIAKAIGLTSVAITDGYYATSRLKASDPDFLITNLNQLKAAIKIKNIRPGCPLYF